MSPDRSYKEGYRDGLNYALILARKYCDKDDFINQIKKELNPEQNDNLLKLDYGKSYLIYERSNEIGMKIASKVAVEGNPLIIITREIQNNIKDLKNVKYALISFDEINGAFNPSELSRLQEFILNNIKEKSVMYMDCVDYFISMNSNQSNVLKFISLIKDRILKTKGIILISLNRDSLDKTAISFLEKEIKNIINFKKED
ncbi:MAG: DUF835 domain-containing protein [Thermoplasmata archaeon]